jgi:hypothetical protein
VPPERACAGSARIAIRFGCSPHAAKRLVIVTNYYPDDHNQRLSMIPG